ncbi:MAG TPA: penicillin-binding protein [Firmicutes bacterium]|jgi:CubicO group peptidase (beta-lactamase class C family)|nr:penicillin-binding protein [Bacillota bacterium]HBG45038.1 penicillin-binding protein [Bacillota bacterium]HBL67356.1 penicillin-binding protein [Bacillota bacterium]HBR25288.1 penicillin-binding protein [Bacillota bacterium]HCF89183.1 penicillin-binding protein [Bacillota bacterium]
MNIEKIWNDWNDAGLFSGVFSVSNEKGVIFERCCGFRNRSEELLNNGDTAFGIASGTKMFTGLAACKLIDAGKLSLHDNLRDLLPFDLGQIDKRVEVHHLLTHTSGIGDYIDEEAPNSIEQIQALYNQYPVYLWERLEYYLPMITPLPQKFEPGMRFGYSNSGFVLLGLVIESVSGKTYQQYVTEEIISSLNLQHTGFYRTDALPANTAYGYMDDDSGQWRTNIFCLPVLGGADGGLFTCAADLDKLWRAVFAGHVLSENMLQAFLKPQVMRNERGSYGLGIYRYDNGGSTAYYAVGGDSGVDFFTVYFPEQKVTASAMGNSEINTYPLLNAMIFDI